MEKNPTPKKATAGSPPLLGSFFQGFRTGAFNSSLMLGIFSAVSFTVNTAAVALGVVASGGTILPLMGMSLLAGTVISTGLFTGALGAKKTYDAAKATAHAAPAASISMQPRSKSRALAQEMELEDAPTNLRSDWAERTGRAGNTQSRVGEIIANGSLADQDRAEAIRARDAEMANGSYRA